MSARDPRCHTVRTAHRISRSTLPSRQISMRMASSTFWEQRAEGHRRGATRPKRAWCRWQWPPSQHFLAIRMAQSRAASSACAASNAATPGSPLISGPLVSWCVHVRAFARARIAEYATQSRSLRLSRRSTSIPSGMEGTRMRGHSGTGSFKEATTAKSGKRCECTSTMRVSKASTVWPAGMSRLARPSAISGFSISRQPLCNLASVASNCMAALSCRTPAPRRPAALLRLLQLREHIKSVANRLTCGPMSVPFRIYSDILILINVFPHGGRDNRQIGARPCDVQSGSVCTLSQGRH